jgi:hypothetical protein
MLQAAVAVGAELAIRTGRVGSRAFDARGHIPGAHGRASDGGAGGVRYGANQAAAESLCGDFRIADKLGTHE